MTTIATLTETSRRPSTCCSVPGAIDLEIDLRVGDQAGHVGITLAPQQYDARVMGPIGDTRDAWIASSGLLESLTTSAQDTLVKELSSWLATDDLTSEIEIDTDEQDA